MILMKIKYSKFSEKVLSVFGSLQTQIKVLGKEYGMELAVLKLCTW